MKTYYTVETLEEKEVDGEKKEVWLEISRDEPQRRTWVSFSIARAKKQKKLQESQGNRARVVRYVRAVFDTTGLGASSDETDDVIAELEDQIDALQHNLGQQQQAMARMLQKQDSKPASPEQDNIPAEGPRGSSEAGFEPQVIEGGSPTPKDS